MTTQTITELRARYDALKASGQAPKALPGPSARPAPEVTPLHSETIPGGWYTTMAVRAGEVLRIQTGASPSAVAVLAWRKDDPSERINYADTIKMQWTSALQKGRVIFSDMGRVMLSIVEDSSGWHDALLGGSNAASNMRKYGGTCRNTRENFLLAAAKLGLQPADIPPCLTFFAPVRLDQNGGFVWHDAMRTACDYVELRAEMDLLVAISNCPHPLDPTPTYDPAPVDVLKIAASPVAADDLCRTATDEAQRGFENLAAIAS